MAVFVSVAFVIMLSIINNVAKNVVMLANYYNKLRVFTTRLSLFAEINRAIINKDEEMLEKLLEEYNKNYPEESNDEVGDDNLPPSSTLH